MESYTSLLEKTRVPQPSFQRFAVQSIFAKLRSSHHSLNSDSEPGRDAISFCLNSTSAAVVDQSVRELCRLVEDSHLDISTGLLELQSSLEGTDPKLVGAFIKGIGFLLRFGFQKHNGYWEFSSTELHPLVQVLSCRSEAQSELVLQVLVFMAQNKQLGMDEVCEFLRPLLNFAILRIPFSDSSSVSFAMHLISSMSSFCCSFPSDSLPVFKLVLECLKYFPVSDFHDFRKTILIFEPVVGAYTVVLRFFAAKRLLISEAQNCGIQLVETILSLFTSLDKQPGQSEIALDLLKLLLSEQKYLGLQWTPQMSSIMHSLLLILIKSEIEHEQLSAAKLLLFILEWKYENNSTLCQASPTPFEELLFVLPLLSLMSSPSKTVTGLATNLLSILEKCLVSSVLKNVPTTEEGIPCLSTPGSMVFRLFQRLWCQDQDSASSTFLLNSSLYGKTEGQTVSGIPVPWLSQVSKYCLSIIDRRKSSLPLLQTQEVFIAEISPFLVAIVGGLVMHPSSSADATDAMALIGVMNPTLGVQLLLAILFYSNNLTRANISCNYVVVKLLGLLPSLAAHPVMIPLVVQTILPMLHKDAKSVLYATAVRLLCQTWETNDRAFTSLHGFLLPKGLTGSTPGTDVMISIAASIRDVCHRNPDRGVELILSVSACIESQHQVVKALGLQSLAHLCEADAVDFYTAWDVIAISMQDYCADSLVAHSMCLLLNWGAMDAEAYPEESKEVLQILLNVVSSTHPSHEIQWAKARTSAIEALLHYEVSHLERMIPDLKKRCIELFFSESNADVIRVMEDFLVKVVMHEHINRRRLVKEKRVLRNKTEKLLDVFPQVIFSSGKANEASDLPGAALFYLPFNTKQRLEDVHAGYENATLEIAASIQLSRNIFIALITLQSWKIFMRHWMRAGILSFNAKLQSNVLDKTSKVANDILKSVMGIAEEAIPRSAESMALAVGALCLVLPPSAHTVKSAASKFLLGWLFQYEHEHRQWPSAISLGLISSCLHVTDHKQRCQNINGLLEVMGRSRSSIVKGACGIGLGFSCQDFFTRMGAEEDDVKKETEAPEIELLGKILRALSTVICQLTHSSHDPLESLKKFFPGDIYAMDVSRSSELSSDNSFDLEEDIWGVAGLVLGLTSTITAVYRSPSQEVVLKIKDIIISWIPHVNPMLQTTTSSQQCEKILSVGSCLALPIAVAFCLKVELINDEELKYLLSAYKELISGLISVKSSGVLYQSLLLASCIGAGTLISFILNAGVHPIEAECIKDFLELFKRCYTSGYPPHVLLGGMLGVVNAMGAGAGILIDLHLPNSRMTSGHERKESSFITGPLLSSSINESYLTTMVQELFLMAQNSDDNQQKQYAAWAVSFLRQHLFSEELQIFDTDVNTGKVNVKHMSQCFPDDSVVMQLSSWLMNNIVAGNGAQIYTAVATLRCLSRAPRLPSLDWGAIIRRCMRYEAQIVGSMDRESAIRIDLRKESIQFAIAHANQFDALLSFLDELSDLSRFRTLEPGLQLCLLVHLADLVKLYSGSRLVKLFHDVTIYFSSFAPNQIDVPDDKFLLRTSCWKGLHQSLHEVSLESLDYMSHIQRCMEVLFTLLPTLESTCKQANFLEEWSQAVKCLSIAPQNWLLDFLQVSQEELVRGVEIHHLVQKKVQVKAHLVKMGALPLTELGKLKSYVLNSNSKGTWDILIELVAALQHGDVSIRRQWLIDAVEISCVSSYPSTALLFLGMLTSMCCKYMPLLIIDQQTVLMDLPVTLSSLLADSTWEFIAEAVTTNLFSSTERIYEWATCITSGENMRNPHPIGNSEIHMAGLLLRVLHHACVLLRRYLPLEKQLKLAKMVVT